MFVEQPSERRKAIKLSVIGSVVIMVIFYLVAISFTFLINLIDPISLPDTETKLGADPERRTNDPSMVSEPSTTLLQNLGTLTLLKQTTTESSPYQFEVSAYVASNDNQDAQQYNQQVLQQVQIFRQDFEVQLMSIFGTVNSADSQLLIQATQINIDNKEQATITYNVATLFAGDSTASEQIIDQSINY